MTAQRLREIAANCEDTSFIASEDNAKELRALADELDRDNEIVVRYISTRQSTRTTSFPIMTFGSICWRKDRPV
jgi:hypothetical protein